MKKEIPRSGLIAYLNFQFFVMRLKMTEIFHSLQTYSQYFTSYDLVALRIFFDRFFLEELENGVFFGFF